MNILKKIQNFPKDHNKHLQILRELPVEESEVDAKKFQGRKFLAIFQNLFISKVDI